MRRSAWLILLCTTCLTCFGQPSYWFQQWQRKPDARNAQEFFIVPGANVTFGYQTNRVIVNVLGGSGILQLTGDVLAGPGASPLATALKNTGTAGTYTKTTFDAQGRETSGTAAILASADFQNQGTTTTLLHGNAAGNPSWSAVNLATDVTGSLPASSVPGVITNLWKATDPPIFLTNDVSVAGTGNLAVGGGMNVSNTVQIRSGTSTALGIRYQAAAGARMINVTNSDTAGGCEMWFWGNTAKNVGYGIENSSYPGYGPVRPSTALAAYTTASNMTFMVDSDVPSVARINFAVGQGSGTTNNLYIERGRVTAMSALNGNGAVNITNSVTATNLVTSYVKWIDVTMNYAYSTAGANAPPLTPVTNSAPYNVISQLAFKNTSELFANAQFQHNVAITNALFPRQYFEPHVHFDTIGTLGAGNTSVTWQVVWQLSDIGGTWRSGTNYATNKIVSDYTHYLADFGHITNDPPVTVSAIFRCRLMRPNLMASEYSPTTASTDVILDGFDLHIPVGNQNAIGSSSETAP